MGWIAVFAGVIGFLVVYLPTSIKVPAQFGPYLSVAVLAGLDAVVGGARAIQDGTFKSNVFLSGFLFTIVAAVIISAFGDSINVPTWFAAVIVFTGRILNNVSYMRRYWLEHDHPHLPSLHLPRRSHADEQESAREPARRD